MFADVARDIAKDLQSTPEWQIEVADDTGKLIFKINVTAVATGRFPKLSGLERDCWFAIHFNREN